MACEVFVWIVTDVTSNLHALESEFLRIDQLKCICHCWPCNEFGLRPCRLKLDAVTILRDT